MENNPISGLFYYRNVIPESIQEELISYLESIPEVETYVNEEKPKLGPDSLLWEKAGIASRKVLHFGYRYPYNRAVKLVPIHVIPEIIIQKLIIPLQSLAAVGTTWSPDQVIVNRYLYKQGIGAHTDHKKLFKDKIVCLTLGEPADMVFKHVTLENATIKTEPGSVYVMTEEARWEYTHEMTPHQFTKPRYSITFRNVDSQYIIGKPNPPISLIPTVPTMMATETLVSTAATTATTTAAPGTSMSGVLPGSTTSVEHVVNIISPAISNKPLKIIPMKAPKALPIDKKDKELISYKQKPLPFQKLSKDKTSPN